MFGAEYLIAVIAAFPLSFVAILSRTHLSINADVFGSFQNCSYAVLALSFRSALGMPMIESSSATSQGYLDFHCRSSAISLLGSGFGPQCKVGQGHKFSGSTNIFQEVLWGWGFSDGVCQISIKLNLGFSN